MPSRVFFDPTLHPRNREGKFATAIMRHGLVSLPGGIHVNRTDVGEYAVVQEGGEIKHVRGTSKAVAKALEMSARSPHSHTLGYRAFPSYAHFKDHERRLRKYFKHKDTPEEWRAKMRDRGLIEALEEMAAATFGPELEIEEAIKRVRIDFHFDENLHPRDRLGEFRDKLDQLPKPKLLSKVAGELHVPKHGLSVTHSDRGGFLVHEEGGGTTPVNDAKAAAEHVVGRVAQKQQEAKTAEEAAKRLESERAEFEKRQAERRERLLEQGRELDRRYARDEKGRRIYRHYAKDAQTLRLIADPQSPSYGELWGQGFGGQRGLEQKGGGEVRSYKVQTDGGDLTTRASGTHPSNDPESHYVDFVVDEALDPFGLGGREGARPSEGYWTMGEADQAAIRRGLIRQETDSSGTSWTKLKIKVLSSSLDRTI